MEVSYKPSLACEIGQEILDKRSCGLIWMSAGNSYFSEQNIQDLILFAKNNFSTVIIVVPDLPAEHTYHALGYSESESKRKARLNSNLLRNRARRIIKTIEQEKNPGLLILVNWKRDVESHEAYKKAYKKVYKLYLKNSLFRSDARAATRSVLSQKGRILSNIEESIDEGVFYLLKELSFIIALPALFNVFNVAYLYHKSWPVYENFVSGKYDGIIKKHLGFLLVK